MPLSLIFGQPGAWPVKVVPIAVNVVEYPPPTGDRCFELGKALAGPSELRRGPQRQVWGTGGMSHQLQGPRAGPHQLGVRPRLPRPADRGPDTLKQVPHIEYLREAGSEGIELVMWLIMRGRARRDGEGALPLLPRAGVQHRGRSPRLETVQVARCVEGSVRIALAGAGAFGVKHLDALRESTASRSSPS